MKKMKKMKKLLSLMLAIVMVVSTVPYAYAEDDSSKETSEQVVGIITNQDELQAALKAGGNYKLGNNITIDKGVYSDAESTAIDLAGYTIAATKSWAISVSEGDLTISGGSTEKLSYILYDGKLTIKDTVITATSSSVLGCHGGEMTLEDVTVNATHGSVVYSNGGTINIRGGAYLAAHDEEMFDSYTGEAPNVNVYAGTFNMDVLEYVAENCEQVLKDGKYVVDSSIKGTAGEGVNWHIDYKGTLTISGTGNMVTDWYAPPWMEYNELIKSVVIEEGITSISGTAFCYAKNLKSVYIPSTVNDIGVLMSDHSESVEEIKVHDDNMNYKSVDGILFSEDEKTLVIYPMNKAGNKYDIPDTVTTIYKYAFYKNKNLDILIIPDTVTSIGGDLISYSNIESVMIGNGITEIPANCFAYSNVKSVVISDSVKEIGDTAFWACEKLETLIMGSGIEVIDEDILSYTSKLSTIHYKGTQEEWNDITIDETNADLNSKELHFFSEDSYVEKVEATCKDGHTAGYYCNNCECYITGEVIPAVKNHVESEEIEENVKSATCITPASKDVVVYCTECRDELSRETIIIGDPLGHKIGADGICTVCGEPCKHRDSNRDGVCDYCDGEYEYKTVVIDKDYSVLIDDDKNDEYVKFIAKETGMYVIESDNGGNDDIDSYVSIYDVDGREIAYDDDNDFIDTFNFYCVFEAEKGKEYFIKLASYEDDAEYEYRISKYQMISHQPTSGKPWIEMAWDYDTQYQWYSLETVEITDANAKGIENNGKATYNSKEGWKGARYDEEYVNFFMVELKAGDNIYMQISENVDEIGIWSDNGNSENFYDIDANEICQFTASDDDIYYVYAECTDDARVRGYIIKDKEAIEGQNKAKLENPTLGLKYICIATDTTGTYTSDILEYDCAITKQPTEGDISVGTNNDANTKYQWYYVDIKNQEITDENAYTLDDGEYDSYYDESGWHASLWRMYSDLYVGGTFFEIYLEENQEITFEFDAYVSEFTMRNKEYDIEQYEENFDGGKLTFKVPKSGMYVVYYYGEEVFTLRAYTDIPEYIAIEGATSPTYTPDKSGYYACKVTFADGTSEMSEKVKVIHEHSFTKYEVKKPAKCGEKGIEVAVCDNGCGKQNEREIPALVHGDKNSDGKCDNGCGYEFKNPSNNNSANGGRAPGAGDNSKLWLWFALLFVSGMGAARVSVNQKKRMISER